MSRAVRRALLLLNVGSPDAPRAPEVRRYLAEFLDDPRVIDLPWLPRKLLLHGAILPFRPKKSAAAYQLVWTEQGSPLLAISRAQRDGLAARLDMPVHLAMRYGRPSIAEAVRAIAAEQVEELVVLPLFPQYASAATGTALAAVYGALAALPFVPAVQVIRPFWEDEGVLDAFALRVREAVGEERVDALFTSFHGLPERQVRNTDASGGCLSDAGCCEAPGARLGVCYRAQCFDMARRLGERVGLPARVGFQSRLGRTPWIQPYTDELLARLPAEGVRRLAVVCPSFVADCLETLEEVAMRGRESFLAAGGERFVFVPCPNDHPLFLDALARRVRAQLGDSP